MEQAERICRSLFLIDHGRRVLSGTMEEIKGRFRKNTVIVEFDGSLDFLEDSALIRSINRYPRWVELEMAEGSRPDELLKVLVQRVSVKKYEVVAPTLHQIFVQHVGRLEDSND